MLTRSLPSSVAGRAAVALTLLGVLAVGVLAGRKYANDQSIGGMTAAFSGITFFAMGFLLLVLAIVASIVGRVGRAAAGSTRRLMLFAVVAISVGFAGGAATAAATTSPEVSPIVHQTTGSMDVTVRGAGMADLSQVAGTMQCRSVGDQQVVGVVTSGSVGQIGDATLQAEVAIGRDRQGSRVMLAILTTGVQGEYPPSWSGPTSVSDASPDGMTGRVEFDVRLDADPDMPVSDAWPRRLSGTISWRCDPWP